MSLLLAERYYDDPNRQVKGMAVPTPKVLEQRKAEIAPIVERITQYGNSVRG